MTRDTDLDGLRATLDAAGRQLIHRQVEAVVKRTAVEVKKKWRANAKESAGQHARIYPYSITFDDVQRRGQVIFTVVGPDKAKRQGALGNLIEYGSVNNPPSWDGKRAAEAEQDAFAKHLANAAAEVLSTDFFGGGR